MKFYFKFIMSFALGLCLCFYQAEQADAQNNSSEQQEVGLFAPVLVGVPTANSAVLSVVNGEIALKGELRYRKAGEASWLSQPVEIPANDQNKLSAGAKKIILSKLQPETHYEFEISIDGKALPGSQGKFITQRQTDTPFSFGIMTDAHVNPANPERNPVLRRAGDLLAEHQPDLVMHLGDNIQTIGSTHGGPAADPNHPNIFYIYFRQVLGELQSNAAQFLLNGNWEGENGWHPALNRSWARDARMLFAPAPDNASFPEGGSKNQDYFAFTWGNALFVSINSTGYNSINHEYIHGVGKADDWTLGKEQYAWLEKTLANSKAKWKFIFAHHAIGGNAGTDVDSRYGRGGGRAAHVGEQAKIHAMMQKYGVQVFFYGHDHVFTDMKVDGTRYICTGSVGAPWKFGTNETGYKNYVPDSGFVLVDVDKNKATIRYISAQNEVSKGKELYKIEIAPK